MSPLVLEKRIPRGRIQLLGVTGVFALWTVFVPAAELAVRAYAPSQTAAGDSFNSAFSPDGGHLVFESWANNLVTNDNKRPYLDVFLRDLEAESTTLVSICLNRAGGGNGDSGEASVSSNGLWVAFASAASDLVPLDTNGQWDVFVRDMNLDQTRLVSRPVSGQGCAWGDPATQNYRLSKLPTLSADGRWVVFESWATNLTDHLDSNRRPDIFARDLRSETTTLVSVNDQGTASGDGGSDHANLAALRPRVAFESKARNLGPVRAGSVNEVYVRDLDTGRLWWASRDVNSFMPDPAAQAREPVLCADGSKLTFKALLNDAGPLLVFDLEADRLEVVPGSAVKADSVVDWSAEGRWIAYDQLGSGPTSSYCYVWDSTGGGPPIRISPFNNPGCGGAGLPAPTRAPSLAWDGMGVVFLANTLSCVSSAETLWYQSIDTSTGAGGSLGTSFGWTEFSTPDHDPSPPVLAPHGNLIAVESRQSFIATNDLNRAQDIFVVSVQSNRIDLASRADPSRPSTAGTGMTTVTPGGVSADGDVIALGSWDSVLSPWDTNFVQELYFSHWQLGTNQPITRFRRSAAFLWEEWLTPGGISRDGRYAVISARGWYGGSLGDAFDHVHWIDLATGMSTHVDTCFRHEYGGSGHPSLHPDGSMVVFQSADYSTCVGSGAGRSQIYLWSSRAGFEQQYQMISLARDGSTGAGNSFNAAFSPDGRWIVFQSTATNLAVQPVSGLQQQLFVRHWAGGSTHLASYDASFRGLSDSIAGPAFSSDSRYLAFYTETGLTSYRHTLPDTRGWKEAYPDGTNNWPAAPSNPAPILIPNLEICASCSHPSLNHDGTLAAYVQHGGGAGRDQIYIKQLDTGTVTLASASPSGEPANGHCSEPAISFDGRFVLFTSLADNLAAGDVNRVRDVFVRDTWLGMTVLLSRSVDGDGTANHASLRPFFASDGRTVVFQSFASDLDSGDYNLTRDIFVVRLAGEDSDGDGLEDDWEAAYFEALDRDGTLDFDMDGHTDRQEFHAGTNPIDDASIVSVLSVRLRWGRPPGAGLARWMSRVSWKSVPGKTYALQYRRNLAEDPWQEWPDDVIANATVTSMEIESHIFSLPPDGMHRAYYRVRLVD